MTQQITATEAVHSPTLVVEVDDRAASVRVVLRGEGDIATLLGLEDALARVTLGDARPVHLDLSGLTFADVATMRRLVVFAREARRSGHTVRTCGARPALRRVADILVYTVDLGIA